MATPTLERNAVNWTRLYREGQRVTIGDTEGSFFIAPYDASQDMIVLMVPCPRMLVTRVRDALLGWAALARLGHTSLWSLIMRKG